MKALELPLHTVTGRVPVEGPVEQAYAMQRAEQRVSTQKATALLVARRDTFEMETGFSENVSSRGARVITAKQWQRGDLGSIALPGFRFTCAARIAYCDPLGNGKYGTGLEFAGPSGDLELTVLATSIEYPRT